jgi:hypothetical protein
VGSIILGTQTVPLSFPGDDKKGVVLPGVTLAPGSVVTFQGQTLSLVSGDSSIIVEVSGSQSTIALYTPAAAIDAAWETVLTIGSSPYTVLYAETSGGVVVLPGGLSLLPGSTTVIDGTTLSLGPEGTALVVGTSTVSLQLAQTTNADASTKEPAGSYVWSRIGGGDPSPTSTPAEFTAGSGRSIDSWRSEAFFAAAIIAICTMVY